MKMYALLILLSISTLHAAAPPPIDSLSWLMHNSYDDRAFNLAVPDIVMPDEVAVALRLYHEGEYRGAVVILEKIRQLQLPDGALDFIAFALAESYRMLDVDDFGRDQYAFVAERFPGSDKHPPSLFRLVQYAVKQRISAQADSILMVFRGPLHSHPLAGAVHYEVGKLYYRMGRFNEAVDLLAGVPRNSSLHAQARFLTGLCHVQLKDWDKAFTELDNCRKRAPSPDLAAEAAIVIGDIYHAQANVKSAMQFYSLVGRSTPRHAYASVKLARCHIDLKEYAKAQEIAVGYLRRAPSGPFAFEMMSVLEQAYSLMGREREAEIVGKLIYRQVINARLSLDVFQELGHVAEMTAHWRRIELEGMRGKNKTLVKDAHDNVVRLQNLEAALWKLAAAVQPSDTAAHHSTVSGLEVYRHLTGLKQRLSTLSDSILRVETLLSDSGSAMDSSAHMHHAAQLRKQHSLLEREYDMVAREHAGRAGDRLRRDEETPAKFIDWAFQKYHRSKKLPAHAHSSDSVRHSAQDFVNDRTIVAERELLRNHISTMLEYYPRSRYNPQILMRLAELEYDDAGEDFERRLHHFEDRMSRGDSAGLRFPDYDLRKVKDLYDRIVSQYPNDPLADDARFYKALALQKEGDYEGANNALLELIAGHPESEFYVEANMLVGRYFFENPKTHGGTGYKRAEDAFREVLYYRDHPQFVQALYNLGWCYYMQDQFQEAIAVFKYLVEEVELNFDPSRVDEQQIVNPLLREEAIDYIAVSFDEGNRLNDAVVFLGLIGNQDYAALVLKRMAELREEMQDFTAALDIYERMLREYPLSFVAPEASAGMIKLYEITNRSDLALAVRGQFLTTFGKGGAFRTSIAARDSALLPKIDSMAVANGLFFADHAYRVAEAAASTDGYRAATQRYEAVVTAYPDHSRSAEALWNLALIREQKLGDMHQAYRDFLAYSRLHSADSSRREQAAMNAIAIAQKLSSDDSALETHTEISGAALMQAVQNYVSQFPGSDNVSDVLMVLGAVYFNDGKYPDAKKAYALITARGSGDRNYHKARFLSGQCHFGQENWDSASINFEYVYRTAPEQQMRESAHTLLIQSEYHKARRLFDSRDFQGAAAALLSVEDRFPGSEYGDVVLFSAAEAFEHQEKWADAAVSFRRLVSTYPHSKYAADALFNAAAAYEKLDDFTNAVAAYEQLADNYPESNKAKDALFNIGFCYEKLGKPDKVAEANVRYTTRYPEEKDARAMILRSAQFYYKTELYEKARNVYLNFVRRFALDPASVEAFHMLGKIHLATGSPREAVVQFDQAELQHRTLVEAGKEGNAYFASEAAFATAEIRNKEFEAIRFTRSAKALKEERESKSRALLEASRAYTRVVQYQSERMFEAAYRIGVMYEQFAHTWMEQKREPMDSIKLALFERDMLEAASGLLQKALVPYKKVIELGQMFDSLGNRHRVWIDSARIRLESAYLETGDLLVRSIAALSQSPIPREIQSQPVYYFQYLKQLNETVEPSRNKARDYFLNAFREMSAAGLEGAAAAMARFSHLNFEIGNGYELLAEQILKKEYRIPPGMSAEEREDVEFTLEDLLFELQDKAIFCYKEAFNRIESEKLPSDKWGRSILEGLARLSPETYGKNIYQLVSFSSDHRWPVRVDTIAGWADPQSSSEGWEPAEIVSDSLGNVFPGGKAKTIWAPGSGIQRFYIRKDLFLPGEPRDAAIRYAIGGNFRLLINGVVLVSDTSSRRTWNRVDSLTRIGSLFKGGDNVLGIEVTRVDTVLPGVTVMLTAMIDTARHFTSAAKLPAFASSHDGVQTAHAPAPTTARTKSLAEDSVRGNLAAEVKMKRAEVLEAIADYEKRNRETTMAVRKERLELQKLRIKQEYLESQLEGIKNEVSELKSGK